MIRIRVVRNKNQISLQGTGHAGFDEKGKDIVCAAASVLFINTINSIEVLTDADINIKQDAETIEAIIINTDEKAICLIDAMVLGLQEIEKQYGKQYISFEEIGG